MQFLECLGGAVLDWVCDGLPNARKCPHRTGNETSPSLLQFAQGVGACFGALVSKLHFLHHRGLPRATCARPISAHHPCRVDGLKVGSLFVRPLRPTASGPVFNESLRPRGCSDPAFSGRGQRQAKSASGKYPPAPACPSSFGLPIVSCRFLIGRFSVSTPAMRSSASASLTNTPRFARLVRQPLVMEIGAGRQVQARRACRKAAQRRLIAIAKTVQVRGPKYHPRNESKNSRYLRLSATKKWAETRSASPELGHVIAERSITMVTICASTGISADLSRFVSRGCHFFVGIVGPPVTAFAAGLSRRGSRLGLWALLFVQRRPPFDHCPVHRTASPERTRKTCRPP